MFARTASVFRRTKQQLCDQPRLTLWSTLVSAAFIAVALLAYLGVQGYREWQARYRHGASMVVYLNQRVDSVAGKGLASDLIKLAGVTRAEYVSPQESESRLRIALSGSEQLLDGIEPNSMPASIELVLEPGIRDVIEISAPFQQLRQSGQIEEVDISGEWSDNTSDALGVIGEGIVIIGMIFAVAAGLVVLLAARLRWQQSGALTAVARLLGASSFHTKLPAALAGGIASMVAALLAVGFVAALHSQVSLVMLAQFAPSMGNISVASLTASVAAIVVAVSTAVGILGASLAGDRV
jgi:cell division transport system permease protein